MASYKELRAQIAALEEQARAKRAEEVATVIEDVREKVAEYGLTPEDVFGKKARGAANAKAATKAKGTLPAMYRDPKTGQTWSGRGRAPGWIKDARNRSRFLIAE
jgi:DNA-binding protein H-NS